MLSMEDLILHSKKSIKIAEVTRLVVEFLVSSLIKESQNKSQLIQTGLL